VGSPRIGRRGDLGPELTRRPFLAWRLERMTQLTHTKPGRPLPNGQVENLQGKFQDKGLNVSGFGNLWEARRYCQRLPPHWRESSRRGERVWKIPRIAYQQARGSKEQVPCTYIYWTGSLFS